MNVIVAQPVIGLVPVLMIVFTGTSFDGPYSRTTFVTGGVHEVQPVAAIGFTIAITKIILIYLNKFFIDNC